MFIQTIKSSSPLMHEREGFVNWALVAAWGGNWDNKMDGEMCSRGAG